MKATDQPERLLTFRSGGWVLLLGGALTAGVLIWGLLGVFLSKGGHDRPATIAEYGFDLENSIVPRELIVIGSEPGVIRALNHPRMISAEEVDEINERERGNHLVGDEMVLGVEVGGEARAYPIRILQWHEVVNDSIAGIPVAVTYNGLCDSAAVFDRRVGDQVLAFEVSGLVYNSNLLMYSTGEEARGRSLWSQLQARAVTGASAGTRLTVLPCALVSWEQWRRAHPDSLALGPDPDPRRTRFYDRDAYGSYQSSDALKFPVRPLPPRDGRPLKQRMIVIMAAAGGGGKAYAIAELAQGAPGDDEPVAIEVDGMAAFVEIFDDPQSALVRDAHGAPVPVMYCYWFAWHAMTSDADRGDAPNEVTR